MKPLPAALLLALMLVPLAARDALAAPEMPPIPIGLDAYRQWEQWSRQRVGVRAYMRSTYDRKGGNERADASHYLYQLAADRNVTLDVEGPGILYFARYNHWHGSPWTYEVDGVAHVVSETSTPDPLHPVADSTFEPRALFPAPLAWTWSQTRGSDLMGVPIPFMRSFRMMYGRTFYGTGYYIYHLIDPAAPTSQPLESWTGTTPPDRDVVDLLGRAGTDLLPKAGSDSAAGMGLSERSGHLTIRPGAQDVTRLTAGPASIRAWEFSAPRSHAVALGRARLRVTWDDCVHPSIDAPLALFHGAGTLHNRENREYLVKAFPVSVRYDEQRVYLACYFPMPFAQTARIELVGTEPEPVPDVRWSVRVAPLRGGLAGHGYLHATYRDHPRPLAGQDLVLLDTRETEGGGEWSGSFIGTAFIFSHQGALGTLEGDPRFFFDDSESPQGYGTGTEEWAGGGDYWGGRTMTLPLFGHPCGVARPREAKSPEDLIESAYRFLLADLMPFGRRALIRLEHGGENQSTEHYETVTYWYGRNQATLVPVDHLQIGDESDERAHAYESPSASAPYEFESRFEWGPDTTGGQENFPAQRARGRTMTGVTEFTLRIRPDNLGVLLRRRLDYAYPNQRAEVEIAPVRADGVGPFRPAGVWYLAGSNTCLFSNVRQELAPPDPIVQTSNRRLREDEFLISRALTTGADAIRVRIRFTPVAIPLQPGAPLPELAWSELRYDAYAFLRPE